MELSIEILSDRRWSYAYAATRRPIIKGIYDKVEEKILSDYANEIFIGSFDDYQNDIVDVFTKYQIKVW